MLPDYATLTVEDAVSYCKRHRNEFIGDLLGGNGTEIFDSLISGLERGTITPVELPLYGMDYPDP